jgi:dCMP deaminase
MAEVLSFRSRCAGRSIGAIVVSADNSYSCGGYNGPPAGMQVPEDKSCLAFCPRMSIDAREKSGRYDDCVTAHAEANALVRADFSRIQGGTIYVSSACCWECGKLVANSGVARVVMMLDAELDAHRDPYRTVRMLEQCGVRVIIWGETSEQALHRARLPEVSDGC